MAWHLDQQFQTAAGVVAGGSCGDGPGLVLAHGWPWSSYTWHRVIPSLAKTHRVYWYDMPGYGKSEKLVNQRTSLDVQGEIFAEMLSIWGLEGPSVVAHDFGGAATLRAHLLHRCEFDRYVLMNVVAMRPWGSEFFDHVRNHIAAFTGLPDHIHKALVEAYVRGALGANIGDQEVLALVEPWLDERGRNSFYSQFAQADEQFTAEVEPYFGEIRCPVKIIWGDNDPWIPIERGRALNSLVPQAPFVALDGVGHLPQLEAPEAVIQELLDFI
jgi:pimeloyl-ACP methyl ester carboxylesterase